MVSKKELDVFTHEQCAVFADYVKCGNTSADADERLLYCVTSHNGFDGRQKCTPRPWSGHGRQRRLRLEDRAESSQSNGCEGRDACMLPTCGFAEFRLLHLCPLRKFEFQFQLK